MQTNGGYWFVTGLEYEQRKPQNNLMVYLRYTNDREIRQAEIYVPYPTTISSYKFFNPNELQYILKRLSSLDFLEKITIFTPEDFVINNTFGHEYIIKKEPYLNFGVINLDLRNDSHLIKNLLKTKFQIGNDNKLVKRKLDLKDRKVSFNPSLELALIEKDKLDSLQRELEYEIGKFPIEDKPHLVLEKLLSLFLTYPDIDDFVRTLRNQRQNYFTRVSAKIGEEFIVQKKDEFSKKIKTINKAILEADSLNLLVLDRDDLELKILLSYDRKNLIYNPLGVKGVQFSDDRLSLEEFLEQSAVILDLEKPLWKRKYEKPLLEAREELLELIKKNPENSEELRITLNEIEKALTTTIDGKEIKIFEQKYDATISNYVLIKLAEDLIEREYHKIINSTHENPTTIINNFPIVQHQNEGLLINAATYSIASFKPYKEIGHNVVYDTIQSREARKKLKQGKFDIGIKGKNPRRTVVRKIYQRDEIPGMEIIDTYYLFKGFHPHEESHKLEAFINFYRKMHDISDEFRKIATHEELRELKIKAMNGDKDADYRLDHYTAMDGEVLNLDYGYYLKTIFLIKNLAPHLSVTEIIFSPKIVMEELHKKLFFDKYHTERFFEREAKKRADEKKIFKKHHEILKKKLLKRNGINFVSEKDSKEILRAYIPVELWMKDVLISIYPKWQEYYDNLEQDPIKKHGMLQFPNKFLGYTLIDYYFYFKERNNYLWHLLMRNLDRELMRDALTRLFEQMPIARRDLLDSYNNCYENLRDHYRSFYTSVKPNIRKLIRVEPIHFEDEFLEEPSMFQDDMFAIDNYDLILTYNFPSIQERLLDNKSIALLERYQSIFNARNEISKRLEDLVNEEFVNLTNLNKRNIIYLLNQRKRAARKRNEFLLCYGFDPDEFDRVFRDVFMKLASELKKDNIKVIGLRGDYLFIDGNLSKDSMLIPLKYGKLEEKSEEEEEIEPSLFETHSSNQS